MGSQSILHRAGRLLQNIANPEAPETLQTTANAVAFHPPSS